jgi:hypothetical protein
MRSGGRGGGLPPLDINTAREKLETLDGSRSKGNKKRAAVRIEDLEDLLLLTPKLHSAAAAGSTPTKEEFDALRGDVMEIFKRLDAISKRLQARVVL